MMSWGLKQIADVQKAFSALNAALRLIVRSAFIAQPSSLLLSC
jgi:hypothetical protein